ncbi:MAG: toxin-antitoxin system YwqK family antitoxin [Myxococcota bacterium]
MRAVWLLLLLVGCAAAAVPDRVVGVERVQLDRNAGVFLVDGRPFSGWSVTKAPDGTRIEQAGFLKGRRHGDRTRWYASGQMMERIPYVSGRRGGLAQAWWSNGTLRSESRYLDDRPHGLQRQWYATGVLFKEARLEHGGEVGLQRAWRENGAIYANYEALNGRTYGLRRTKPCFQLEEEDVVPTR